MGKKIAWSVGILVAVLLAWQWELVVYGVRQAYGQARILYLAEPIEEFLTDPTFPDSLKQKLRLVQEIRRFAVDSLGINDSRNYTTMYDQQGKPVLWVVTACEPYALKSKEWTFPLLGTFSYKGFFRYDLAEKEAAKLKADSLDTDIGEVAGWSTLGWFRDPILSSMLYRNEGQLANLIIHELTHATLYVKDNVEYNENLASFVGDQGAQLFLAYRYGRNSREYQTYENSKHNRAIYSAHILRGADHLDSLYRTFQPSDERARKDTLKYALIRKIMESADTLSYAGTPRRTANPAAELPNNTYFMDYIRYRARQNQFEEEFRTRFASDFKRYLAYLKEKYPSL